MSNKDATNTTEPKKPVITTPDWPTIVEFRELPCKLSTDDIALTSSRMAENHREIAILQERLKEINADYKAKIKRLQNEQNALANTIQTGETIKSVECIWLWEVKKITADGVETDPDFRTLQRTDTKVAVTTIKITDEDRQRALPLAMPEPMAAEGDNVVPFGEDDPADGDREGTNG